jgi:hypothetical protein
MLVAEGFGQHINKGYIPLVTANALGVEILERLRTKAPKVDHQPYVDKMKPPACVALAVAGLVWGAMFVFLKWTAAAGENWRNDDYL